MFTERDGQVFRRHKKSGSNSAIAEESNRLLTLVDEIYILAMNDGRTSFWNVNLSASLRGCILVELNLLGRIELEPPTVTKRSIVKRKVVVANASLTGERILDETLKHIIDCKEGASVNLWLDYLNGDNWNPWYWRYQLKAVKERLAKDLVEKGILNTDKCNYLLFETIVHPLKTKQTKIAIAEEIQNGLLKDWKGRPHRLDIRILSLILLSYAADILDEILSDLDSSSFSLARMRLDTLLDCDFENEAPMEPKYELSWSVFNALLNQ